LLIIIAAADRVIMLFLPGVFLTLMSVFIAIKIYYCLYFNTALTLTNDYSIFLNKKAPVLVKNRDL